MPRSNRPDFCIGGDWRVEFERIRKNFRLEKRGRREEKLRIIDGLSARERGRCPGLAGVKAVQVRTCHRYEREVLRTCSPAAPDSVRPAPDPIRPAGSRPPASNNEKAVEHGKIHWTV